MCIPSTMAVYIEGLRGMHMKASFLVFAFPVHTFYSGYDG